MSKFRRYSGVRTDEVKQGKTVRLVGRPGVDLNQAPTEQKSEALPLQPTFLANSRLCVHIMEIIVTSNRKGQAAIIKRHCYVRTKTLLMEKNENLMDIIK